jgi:hypothetical protein
MPVNETLEMYERLRGELAMPLGAVFINRLHQPDLKQSDLEELEVCLQGAEGRDQPLLKEVRERAREELGWAEINHRYRTKLTREVKLPVIEIPFLFAEEFGISECQAIASMVEAAMVASRHPKRHQRGRD